MEKIKKIINKNFWFVFVLLSLPAVRYLFINGFYGVSDDLHIAWLHQMDRIVRILQFPPRFVPDLSYNFGYPLFTFVYPLPFYLAEVFNLVGFSLVDSMKIVFGLSIPFSMYFMYRFLKNFLSTNLSLVGAILYVYNPYRAVELFVRGSVGEIVAFVFFPLILTSVVNGNYILLGFSTAALILSHNILSYMFFPFIGLLMVLYKKHFWMNLKGIILGLLMSIYFWFPAIIESGLFKYDTVFNFYDHFPTLKQLVIPFFDYGASVAGPYDTMSFNIGIVQILIIVLSVFFFIKNYKSIKDNLKVIFIWVLIVFCSSIFMMNHRSAFVWETVPLLPYFQFPWRFLSMISLTTPIFLTAFVNTKRIDKVLVVIGLSAIVLNFNYFKFSEYLGRNDSYYLNRYVPINGVSDEYRQTSEEYLRLPKSNEERPKNIYPRFYTNSPSSLEVLYENTLNASVKTDSDSDFLLNYTKYYYPGWYGKVDGKKVEIGAGKPFGQIVINVPEGKHIVDVGYKESSFRLVFDTISLITFVYCVFVLRKNILFKKKI